MTGRSHIPCRAAAAGLLAALFAAWVGGCAPAAAPRARAEPFAPPHATTSADILAEPVVAGGASGLELRVVVVDDVDESVARALQRFVGEPSPLDDATARRWRDGGLRMVRVPLGELASVLASLHLTGRLDREWLGQCPDWRPLFLSASTSAGQPVRVEGGLMRPGEGRFRVLIRGWTAPTGGDPVVRVELAVQHVPAHTDAPFSAPAARSLLAEGLVFPSLAVRAALEGGAAYVIVPESPEADWTGPGAGASERDAAPPAQGPREAPSPTVGELTLMGNTDRVTGRANKAIVVLIPRVPARLTLLP